MEIGMAVDDSKDDVFLLYNEREEGVEKVVEALRQRGISVYFFRSDFPFGQEIESGEAAKLDNAQAVVVTLGGHGWGPTQRKIAERAILLQKSIVPVLTGEPPEEALDDIGMLFRNRRWLDLRNPDPTSLNLLVEAVRQTIGVSTDGSPPLQRFDEIFKILIDGSEADRSAMLAKIRSEGVRDSETFAQRLRQNIRENFSPKQEAAFATSIRDPKRLTSTRSWMLSVLIWLRPMDDDSAQLILEHLDTVYEPDRAVRFWVLAGIIHANLPIRSAAIRLAVSDKAREVSGLASLVLNPADEGVLAELRSAIYSQDFETAWFPLRILRVFPVVQLARDVVDQLERPVDEKLLTYDALFALANPEMASAARPHILERLGLVRFAELILLEARGSTPVALSAFAPILSVFDRDEVEKVLREKAQDAEDRQLVRQILSEMDRVVATDDDALQHIPGHSPEAIDITKDDIGIGRDVQMLASVVLAQDVRPPLAVGLFGEWGSGKSFYIKSLEATIAGIAQRAASRKDERFCSRVVQIHYNAWHYVDANLWASLVSHLLDGLSRHLSPAKTAAEQRAALTRDLASARAEIELAKGEQTRAAEQLLKNTEELQSKVFERERSEVKLKDLRAADLVNLLSRNQILATTLKNALDAVGAPAAFESISELDKVVEESYSTAGRAFSLLNSLVRGRNIAIGLGGILLFLIGPPLIVYCVNKLVGEAAADISDLLAKAAIAVGSTAVILRSALSKVKAGLDQLSQAKRNVDHHLAELRSKPTEEELGLERAVTQAKANEKAAAERVAAATVRAKEIEGRVVALEESRSLGYFVAERSRSEDYRRHLGLISMIRKDFDGLVERLQTAQSSPGGIDRIVLYIDDVDRCPPQMVVDILQAVHLLLAYELFVVVVSVDPRWLKQSLESQLVQLTREPGEDERYGASPQDYLEKIFQIPFTVKPMGQAGFGRLMRRLFSHEAGVATFRRLAEVSEEAQPANSIDPAGDRPLDTPVSDQGVVSDHQVHDDEAVSIQLDEHVSLEAMAEALSISTGEADFAARLFALLPTPRSAKRFANIYRLLKASVRRADLSAFQGSAAVPGSFQLPMLLLGLLVGEPLIASKLFPAFLAQARSGKNDWWEADWTAVKGIPEADRIRAHFEEIARVASFPHSPNLLVHWLPEVARYSFATANIFVEEH
ncbi:hypothetical protein E5S70_35455 [Ensifer adhaerens]|uniref:P-loop NTPase fold protein n=1 Tax=Ensifer canadensis TaxID=555315 RepID=UPI0014907837|nr:P-loop NTPase fold protein [Ensifer canadensis]NOV21227.1 hypothetical protein [Ensifer canadensis]